MVSLKHSASRKIVRKRMSGTSGVKFIACGLDLDGVGSNGAGTETEIDGRADLQDEVEDHNLGDRHVEARGFKGAEARGCGDDVVLARGKLGNFIGPLYQVETERVGWAMAKVAVRVATWITAPLRTSGELIRSGRPRTAAIPYSSQKESCARPRISLVVCAKARPAQ
jgi:hypothetical protein